MSHLYQPVLPVMVSELHSIRSCLAGAVQHTLLLCQRVQHTLLPCQSNAAHAPALSEWYKQAKRAILPYIRHSSLRSCVAGLWRGARFERLWRSTNYEL
jgi:hypothetical protein